MKTDSIKKVCCIGAGIIGSSWATLFAKNGLTVNVYDSFPTSLDAAEGKIRVNLQGYIDNGHMTQEQVDEVMKNISYFDNLADALEGVQFIQESVPEVLEIKQTMVDQIDECNADAIVCSSTSGMNISDISGKSKYPGRYIGGHPFNPPHLMPLVELTKWEKTDDEILHTAEEFYKLMKKVPVILKKESPGFIGNRLQHAVVREAITIIMEDICSVEDLDKALVFGLGLRWAILGPNLVGELNGGEKGISNYLWGVFREGWDEAFQRLHDCSITKVPEEYALKIGPEGVAEEKKNREPGTGNTNEEIAEYRDKMLMDILALHNKL